MFVLFIFSGDCRRFVGVIVDCFRRRRVADSVFIFGIRATIRVLETRFSTRNRGFVEPITRAEFSTEVVRFDRLRRDGYARCRLECRDFLYSQPSKRNWRNRRRGCVPRNLRVAGCWRVVLGCLRRDCSRKFARHNGVLVVVTRHAANRNLRHANLATFGK